MRPRPSWAFCLRATLLLLALLFAAAGPAFSYLYQQDVSYNCSVTQLRVTDIYLPKTVRIDWNYTGLGGLTNPVYEVRRRLGMSTTVLGQTTNKYWVDTFDWSWSSGYDYDVRVVTDYEASMGLPAPPMGANPSDIFMRKVASGSPWVTIRVVPEQITVSQNQTVDSRLDLRYATNVYKDFQFGTRIYRGGLYAGYCADPSKVGRSFLQFNMGTLPTANNYWTGSLNLYHTRSIATGTATIGAQPVGDGWTGSLLAWSTAPTIDPTTPTKTATVAWNSSSMHADYPSKWVHWTMEEAIGIPLVGDGVGSYAVAATNEASNAWAYFAKQEWDSTYGPKIVYARGASAGVLELTASPQQVVGGAANITGTVWMNGTYANAQTVNLSSSNAAKASVPSSISIPAFTPSGTFTITTASVMATTDVTITATRNGDVDTFVVRLVP